MKPAQCRSCGAPVIWAINERTKKRAPIDAEPADNGPIVFVHDPGFGGDPEYRVLAKADRVDGAVLRAAGIRPAFYTNHFQTCPNARQHATDRR